MRIMLILLVDLVSGCSVILGYHQSARVDISAVDLRQVGVSRDYFIVAEGYV